MAAATREGDLTYYSNYGSTVEVSARGRRDARQRRQQHFVDVNDGAIFARQR